MHLPSEAVETCQVGGGLATVGTNPCNARICEGTASDTGLLADELNTNVTYVHRYDHGSYRTPHWVIQGDHAHYL